MSRSPTITPAPEAAAQAARMRALRYLVVYPAHSARRMAHEEAAVARFRGHGYDVRGFGVPCPDGWWDFPRLDAAWRAADPALMRSYEVLAAELARTDVVIASGGSMLHPELLRGHGAYSVFVCGDDPENSDRLSRPVAPSFDHCMPTNIACVDDYRAWGCARVDWIFPPLRPDRRRDGLTVEDVLEGRRDTPITMLSERVYGLSDRAQRLERLHREFPEAVLRGEGWPLGFLPAHEVGPLLADTRLGWNLHNSIGPCNTRLMELPAWGVLQVCDNRARLGPVFELDREVVGFETIDECVPS
ncbi:MAG: glycosyltransferase [Planctomycetota bacterium]